jgi:hypothetical protein
VFNERAKAKLERYGEEFEIDSFPFRGVFRVLDSGTLRAYLDDVEAMAVVHPALLLITAGDTPIIVNDTITRDGRTYTVLKVSNHRIGDTTVVKLAVLA